MGPFIRFLLGLLGFGSKAKKVLKKPPKVKPKDAKKTADKKGNDEKERDAPCQDCDKVKNDPIKDKDKLRRQMDQRGWTDKQIDEAISQGKQFPAKNFQTGGSATRYVHPQTGRSVIVDDTTKGIIQVGGDGFKF